MPDLTRGFGSVEGILLVDCSEMEWIYSWPGFVITRQRPYQDNLNLHTLIQVAWLCVTENQSIRRPMTQEFGPIVTIEDQ